MIDQTDRRLSARFDAIANRNDDSDWQTIVEQSEPTRDECAPPANSTAQNAIRPTSGCGTDYGRGRCCLPSGDRALERFNSDRSPGKSAETTIQHHPRARHDVGARTHPTRVATLVAFTSPNKTVAASDLPASVSEVVAGLGADPASAQLPFKGPPAVYLFRRGTNNLCIVEALSHASGSCFYVLTAAGGTISNPSLTIVDGKEFVDGLAANDVEQITASNAPTDLTPSTTNTAVVENNIFVISLPYNGGSVGTVTVDRHPNQRHNTHPHIAGRSRATAIALASLRAREVIGRSFSL